jgi:hypothetical protein
MVPWSVPTRSRANTARSELHPCSVLMHLFMLSMEVKGAPPQALSFTPSLDELALLGLPHKLGNIEICRLISEYEGFRLTAGQEKAKSAILKAVQQGRDVMVTGPAGRGKSTLMNTLGKRFVVLPVPRIITFWATCLHTNHVDEFFLDRQVGSEPHTFAMAVGNVLHMPTRNPVVRPVVWFPDDKDQAQVYRDQRTDRYCLSTLEQRNEQFEHVVLE